MIYHYTSKLCIKEIIETGVLLPLNKYNEHSLLFNGARLALSFTTSNVPDRTASVSYTKDKEIWRIGVEDKIAPLTWNEYHAIAVSNGEPRKFLRALKALSYGSWRNWRFTFDPVYKKDFKIIEHCNLE